MDKKLGLEDEPNPAYVFSQHEINILWEFLKWQHLSYHNPDLKALAKQIGEFADDLHISRK